MNKAAIKNYAIWARVQLIEAAKQKAYEYDITDGGENKPGQDTIGGRLLSKTEKEQRIQLIAEINRKGFSQVMEEAAYTWFNRFIALRFMEVNGYLPSKVRVFTDENGDFKPEILKQAISVELEGLDRSKVLDLLDKQDNEELFKYLLITQCNALNVGLPYMFEKIGGWTELLFPANLLRQDSVIGQMISEIPEEDWTDAVQIIGWMYQYYNSELKDETFALLKKNVKITKERIPAATQLFTPDWIVRYMVENSLGRLWYEGHPDFDKSQWKYYLDEAEQEPEVEAQLQKIRAEYSAIRPEEIKVIDPCMGSGHILVYAFDVLMQIYTSSGWSERDAAKSILESNLYGLDIDDRAGQLAYFAIMMKARKYSRRILSGDVKPNVLSIQDSNWMTDEFIAYVAGKDATMKADLVMLRKTFRDAKEYGSILSVPTMQYDALFERINIISRSYAEDLFQSQYNAMAVDQLLPLVKQSRIMSQKYDVTVSNPPYMGASGMSSKLAAFLKEHYPNSKSDMFSCCMEKAFSLIKRLGFVAMITMESWMFLSSFEHFREHIVDNMRILNLVHMPYLGKGGTSLGINFGTCAFVIDNARIPEYAGQYDYICYFDLNEDNSPIEFPIINDRYTTAKQSTYKMIPGHPIAYWVSKPFVEAFDRGISIDTISDYTGSQNKTADNEKYLRLSWEISNNQYGKNKRWITYAKGGDYRKHYGNLNIVVDWSPSARHFYRNNPTSNLLDEKYWYQEGITYTMLTSRGSNFRYMPPIGAFDMGGPVICKLGDKLFYTLAFLNSKVAAMYLRILNPTINLQAKDVKALPLIIDDEYYALISDLEQENVSLSREEWDSFETSLDFKKPEYLTIGSAVLISDVFNSCLENNKLRIKKMKANEELLNSYFIQIYNLSSDVDPSVEEKDITVNVLTEAILVKQLISYAVGCMFGRYSVDKEGLCYAGGQWDPTNYLTITPDEDNIIPICDDDYFDDDIVGKFIGFIRKVFGEETLEQNLRYISDALGGKGSSREVIRNYFLNDFFTDHCSTYSVTGSGRRPIYWLFSSGKKNGFKALIYMHRYQPDLLARMRTDYVHEQQERYRTQLQMLEISTQSATPSERVKLNKQITKLKDQALEIQKYEEKIHHLADQMISIDLDDGVKVNYAKFQDVLEKIK